VKGVKALVTGGAGFIGSHTVDALLTRGASVVVVDQLSTGRRANVNPNAEFYELDIADPAFEDVLLKERPDVVFHFAFHVLVPKGVENPLLELDGVVGSLRLLEAARRIGVRKIVFASSGFLYGNTPHLPASEAEPIDPVTPYVVAKQAVEGYLRFYRRTYRLASVVLRYAAIYGPRQSTGAMADYIRKLAAGAQADIWGDGTKTRDYVYVADAVEANLLALSVADDHPNPIFNVGTGVETTLNEIYRRIAALLGARANPIYHADRPGEQIRYCLDSQKARRELGWTPRYTLDEGLRLTVEASPETGSCRR
jgi:UDP-glucose 4-epimerase